MAFLTGIGAEPKVVTPPSITTSNIDNSTSKVNSPIPEITLTGAKPAGVGGNLDIGGASSAGTVAYNPGTTGNTGTVG